MKTTCFIFISFFCTAVYSQQIELEITNITSSDGNIMIAVYDRKNGFLDRKKAYSLFVIPAKKGKITVPISVTNLKQIAIAVFHDKNVNTVLDKNLLGAPTEGYGFSNNARRTFSVPSFEAALINIKGLTTTTVRLD